jgi:hypothetical protein
MAKFTAHTAVHGERGTVFFKPGDTVPEWAAGKVGDHVTDGSKASSQRDIEAPEPDAGEAEAESGQTEAPDFTTPKPRQTRTRRK